MVSPVDSRRSHADPRADRQVVVFGLVAISSSWLWSPLVVAEWGWIDGDVTRYWHLAGSLGPAIAAIVLTPIYDGWAGFGLLVRRMITGPIPWLLGAVLVPLLFCLVGLGLAKSLGQVDLSAVGTSEEYPTLPVAVYWLVSLVFYGYGEEIGWRGFALPRLQRQRDALRASLWLSLLWGVWHLPLFVFSAGLSTMPAIGVLGWAASIVTGTVICTWLFNSTRGSIAVLAVFHASFDTSINSPTGGEIMVNVMGAVVVIVALMIPRRYGREDLSALPKVTRTRPPARGSAHDTE
jgi:uncharacterized protein